MPTQHNEKKATPTPRKSDRLIPERQWPDWLKSSFGFFLETLKIVVISLAIILPIRYFLVQPFYVRGASMEPTFDDYQYLLIDEISYRFSEPKRGDVVVFRYPEDRRQFFIKRVIGLPGERVDIQDGSVVIHPVTPEAPFVLQEPYLTSMIETECLKQFNCKLPLTLADNEFIMLGDNRPASLDSRYFGIVNRDEIIGKAWLRIWPFSTFTIFKQLEYNR